MNKKSFRPRFINILTLLFLGPLFTIPICAQTGDDILGQHFNEFKNAAKLSCGKRDEAIRLGNQLVEKYGNDELNKEVIEYVKKKVAEIKEAEPTCARNILYNQSYKSKNWIEFYKISQRVIDEEGDNPLALDVILTLVSVGYNLTTVYKIDAYNLDTLYYANLAIRRIEAGQKSKTGKYGVFEPFSTKEEALSWMNYIIGWQMYYKLNQKKESLPYFYKSTQIGNEKKNDADIYVTIGKYYLDDAERIPEYYLDKTTDEMNALMALDRAKADRAMDAFGRAYKILKTNSKANPEAKNALADVLAELYKFRFKLEKVESADDVNKYVEKLLTRPMPNPAIPVEPVSEESVEYIPNKSQ